VTVSETAFDETVAKAEVVASRTVIVAVPAATPVTEHS